jgi:hypothetical protein
MAPGTAEDPYMMKRNLRLAALAFACGGALAIASPTLAAGKTTKAPAAQNDGYSDTDRPIYGRELMTQKEINAYNHKMDAKMTEAQREKVEHAHRVAMDKRAKARGTTISSDQTSTGATNGPTAPGNGGAAGPGSSTGADEAARNGHPTANTMH